MFFKGMSLVTWSTKETPRTLFSIYIEDNGIKIAEEYQNEKTGEIESYSHYISLYSIEEAEMMAAALKHMISELKGD